jgi:hypothetical protein
MKTCYKCNIEKEITGFYRDKSRKDGFRDRCKQCCKEYQQTPEFKERQKTFYNRNSAERQKEWKKNNPEKYKESIKKGAKKRLAYDNFKYKTDIKYKLAQRLRGRIRDALRYKGSKGGSAVKDLGCSLDFFKEYIESKFSEGMTWNNHGLEDGKWHLDHIKPLALFDLTNREQFLQAAHYTNYQPLWAKENLIKWKHYKS